MEISFVVMLMDHTISLQSIILQPNHATGSFCYLQYSIKQLQLRLKLASHLYNWNLFIATAYYISFCRSGSIDLLKQLPNNCSTTPTFEANCMYSCVLCTFIIQFWFDSYHFVFCALPNPTRLKNLWKCQLICCGVGRCNTCLKAQACGWDVIN